MHKSDNTFVFFKPSVDLTNEIIKQNQALVKEYTVRTAPEPTDRIDGDDSDPSRLAGGYQQPVRRAVTSPVETGQHAITARMYNYLSSLSESRWAMEGGTFPVSEYLPKGMITMLGFSSLRKEPDSQPAIKAWQLVEQLTEEFVDWLANEQNGSFVMPWLEIHLTTDGELRLIAISDSEDEDGANQESDKASEYAVV